MQPLFFAGMPNRFSLHESDYRGRGRCRRDIVAFGCCRVALIVEKGLRLTSGLDDVAVIDRVDNFLGAQDACRSQIEIAVRPNNK